MEEASFIFRKDAKSRSNQPMVECYAVGRYVLVVLGESFEGYVAAIETARETIQSSPFIRDDADRALGDQFLRTVVNWSGIHLKCPVLRK